MGRGRKFHNEALVGLELSVELRGLRCKEFFCPGYPSARISGRSHQMNQKFFPLYKRNSIGKIGVQIKSL